MKKFSKLQLCIQWTWIFYQWKVDCLVSCLLHDKFNSLVFLIIMKQYFNSSSNSSNKPTNNGMVAAIHKCHFEFQSKIDLKLKSCFHFPWSRKKIKQVLSHRDFSIIINPIFWGFLVVMVPASYFIDKN